MTFAVAKYPNNYKRCSGSDPESFNSRDAFNKNMSFLVAAG
jgi:hypothetical protein